MKGLDTEYEKDLLEKYEQVVGIDEVGRGSLAYDVFVCGYIFKKGSVYLDGVNDSKQLTEKKRNEIFINLKKEEFIVKKASALEIDEYGIAKCIENLIAEICETFDKKTFILIDGRFTRDFGENTLQVVKGDTKIYSIALASIVAKCLRDKAISTFADMYPQYLLDQNKGYGTAEHLSAIKKYGATQLHRKSFEPIKSMKLEK